MGAHADAARNDPPPPPPLPPPLAAAAADAILLVGTNPRIEAPVLNARIRTAVLSGTTVGLVGKEVRGRQGSAEGRVCLPALTVALAPPRSPLHHPPTPTQVDLTYSHEALGEGADALDKLLKPGSEWLKRLKGAER